MSSKITQRRYCGPKLLKRQKELTSKCFELAVSDIMKRHKIRKNLKDDLVVEMRGYKLSVFFERELKFPNIEQLKDEVDQRYRDLVCSLKSKDIEDIIWAHDAGKFRRAQITLDALKNELTRRSILDDGSQSDPRIYERGVTDVKSTKKPRRSPSSKKRKSSKGR